MEKRLIPGLPVIVNAKGTLCIDVKEVVKSKHGIPYPYIQEIIERFAWVEGKKTQLVAFDDMLWGMRVYKESFNFNDFKTSLHDEDLYKNSNVCHVCGQVAFPDEEMYSCILTGKPVCELHSMYSEEFNGYVTYLISNKA